MSDYEYNELDTEGAILEKRASELEGADPEQSKKLLEQYEKEDKLSKSIEEDTPRDDNWLNDTISLLDNKSKQGDASKNVTGGSQTTSFNKPIPKVYGSGKPTYGIISNKDPNWDAKVKANRQAKENRRNAIRAGMDAANAKREELLGTGKYYDDGSGNLRLKKKYAVIGGGRGRREYDFGQEKAQYEIQQAGQKAYDAAYDGMDFNSAIRRQQVKKAQRGKAKTNQLVELNKAEMEERKKLKAEREVRNAKQDLAIYDGLVVAFKSLDDDGEEAQQVLKESPYDFKTQTKDSQGRVIGVGGEKKQLAYAADDGYRMQDIKDANGKVIGKRKFGIVGVKAIDEINKKLAEQGNKQYKVTAIVAQQKIDAIGNKSGEPVFYIQRLFADGTQRADTLTMKEIYQLGLKGYKTTGVAEKDAENNVIDSLGDIMGTRKRQTEALMRDPKYRKSVLDAEKAKIEVAKVGFDMRTSQINSLMAQRKALVDEGAPGSEEAIATIDKKIAMLNEMNGAATGVNEFARAMGVTINRQTPKTEEVKNDEAVKKSNNFVVKKSRIIGDKPDGAYVSLNRGDGVSVDIYIPKGKVIKTSNGNFICEFNGESAELVSTDKKADWSLYEAVTSNWANKKVDSGIARADAIPEKKKEAYIAQSDKNFREEHPYLSALADAAAAGDGYGSGMNPGYGSVREGIKSGKRRSTANWGARRRNGTSVVSQANSVIDKNVAHALGISVEEATKMRENHENKKK